MVLVTNNSTTAHAVAALLHNTVLYYIALIYCIEVQLVLLVVCCFSKCQL
jgi:hypothetical protein